MVGVEIPSQITCLLQAAPVTLIHVFFVFIICRTCTTYFIDDEGQSIGGQYNTVQYNLILHTSLQWLWHNIHQSFSAQNTPHIWPYPASCGMSFMTVLEKIDHGFIALHCIPSILIGPNNLYWTLCVRNNSRVGWALKKTPNSFEPDEPK